MFAVRWMSCEFLLGRVLIWISIKHPAKGVSQLYSIGNAEFIEGNLEDSEESYIAKSALFGFL